MPSFAFARLPPPPSSLHSQSDEGKGPLPGPKDVKKPKKAAPSSSAPRGRPASMNPGFWDAVEAERSGRHEVGIKAALAAAAAVAGGTGSSGIGSAVGGGAALPRHRQGEVVLLVELQAGAAVSVMARFWSHVLKVRGRCGCGQGVVLEHRANWSGGPPHPVASEGPDLTDRRVY